MLTAERLREVLRYEPETGEWFWRVAKKGIRAGDSAGHVDSIWRYRTIRVDRKLYRSARLAVLYMTGSWPENQVDHINMVRDDDRWGNLRGATNSDNGANRTAQRNNVSTGIRGVYKEQGKRGYCAKIKVRGKKMFLGRFSTIDEARAVYETAYRDAFGDFARVS